MPAKTPMKTIPTGTSGLKLQPLWCWVCCCWPWAWECCGRPWARSSRPRSWSLCTCPPCGWPWARWCAKSCCFATCWRWPSGWSRACWWPTRGMRVPMRRLHWWWAWALQAIWPVIPSWTRSRRSSWGW